MVAHATSVQALHKRTKSKKVASISRLNSRLQARSAKGKPQSADVDAKGSVLDFPRPKEVQVEPKRDENADFTCARRKAAASIQMKEAESGLNQNQVESNDKNRKHKGEMKEEKKSIVNQGSNKVSAVVKTENVPTKDGL